MNLLRKYFRLLPLVVAVGVGLLAIKGVDLARAAQAPAANSDTPDNSGLAPSDNGGAHTGPDFAADGGTSASAAEVDVLTSLAHRRAELDARERALNMRENLLNAGEGRVDQKIAALKALQAQIQGLLAQRDAAQDKQIASLVKTYSAMKPKDAARIFDTLADEVLIPVAKDMKSDVLAPVLAAMNSEAAQRLTVKLASLLKLPEPTPAADCPAAAIPSSTAAPATAEPSTTSASSAPPNASPLQTAVLTPPPAIVPPVQVAPAAAPAPTPAAAPTPAKPAAAPKPRKPIARKVTPEKPAPANPASTALAASGPANTSVAPPAPKPVAPAVTPAATPAATAPQKPATPDTAKPAPTSPANGPPASLTPSAPTGG